MELDPSTSNVHLVPDNLGDSLESPDLHDETDHDLGDETENVTIEDEDREPPITYIFIEEYEEADLNDSDIFEESDEIDSSNAAENHIEENIVQTKPNESISTEDEMKPIITKVILDTIEKIKKVDPNFENASEKNKRSRKGKHLYPSVVRNKDALRKKHVELTDDDIYNEFRFEEETICIDDEVKSEDMKKTLVRLTKDGYQCPLYCTFKSKDKSLMIGHLINHKKSVVTLVSDKDESFFLCPLCPFTTLLHSDFVKHVWSHRKKSIMFPCSKCSLIAPSKYKLKQHVVSSHGAYLHCQNCTFKTRIKKTLTQHEAKCKRSKRSTFQCHFEPCPFVASTAANLKTHEWIQHQVGLTKIRSYKCTIEGCHFDTIRRETFDDHMALHACEELRCKLCNYKTELFTQFKEHILEHISVF